MTTFRHSAAIAGASLLIAAGPAPYFVSHTLLVTNQTGGALECHAIAAHWYGFDLGRLQPGARLVVPVHYDRQSGVIAAENDRGRLMPLQMIYCGPQGDAWRGRATIPMRDMLEQDRPAVCRTKASRIDCQG